MLAQLGPQRASAAGGRARPGLLGATTDFNHLWGRVSTVVAELLVDPYSKPSIHVMTVHQHVYTIAGGTCTDYPPPVSEMIERYKKEQLSTAPQGPGRAAGAAAQQAAQRSPYALLQRDLLASQLKEHLAKAVAPKVEAAGRGEALLSAYVRAWTEFMHSVRSLSSVFSYVHTVWIAGRSQDGTRQLGLGLWREIVYEHVQSDVVTACLEAFASERSGVPITRDLVTRSVESLLHLSPKEQQPLLVYQTNFETEYLQQLQSHLSGALLACRQEAGSDVRVLLRGTAEVLRSEVERAVAMLPACTRRPLMQALAKVLSPSDVATLHSGLREYVDNGDRAELGELLWLAKHTENGMPTLCGSLTDVVRDAGRAAVAAGSGPVAFVVAAFTTLQRCSRVVEEHLESNAQLMSAVIDAARDFVNDPPGGSSQLAAEHLAAFTLIALRTGTSTARTELDRAFPSLDAATDAGVALLKLLADRDIFQARYAGYLSARVLANTYRLEFEQVMQSAFARVTAHDYSYKWQRMLTDVERSAESTEAFAESEECRAARSANAASSGGTGKLDFRVLVATQGSWPLAEDEFRVSPPVAIATLCDAYRRFYLRGGGGESRRLAWVHSQSSATLRSFVTKRRYEITVSFAQAALLLAFDAPQRVEILTCAHVSEVTGVPTENLLRPLAVLLRLKLVQLSGEAKAAEAANPTPNTRYTVNEAFSTGNLKVNALGARDAGAAGAAPSSSAADGATQRVVDDRKFAVQAAIVRVAKSRRTVTFQELIADVITLLQGKVFTPTVQSVKTNIEALIDKEYLERADGDNDTLNYVA